MNRFLSYALVLGMVCSGIAGALTSCAVAATDDDQVVLQADRALLQAIGKADKAAVSQLLDADFTWIDSAGKSQSKAEVLQNLPTPANNNVEVQERTYGQAAVVRANRGRVQVMRIWAKRPTGWQAVLYQELTLSTQPRPAAAPGGSTDCQNPCKTIPYQPKTENEKEAIAAMQGVQVAITNNDAEAYAPLIADEFAATNTPDNVVFTKADRIAILNKQKETGVHSLPSPIVTARVFDFGDAVLIMAAEQPRNPKMNLNTRMMIKRDGRWQMLFSFNTRIQ
jgi:hypothetical protein